MGIFSLLTPLVHVVSQLGGDSMSTGRANLGAQPGSSVASVDGCDWKATGITIQLVGQKASIRTVNSFDNSALNIEFSVKKSIEAMYYFIPSLRTMIATGKKTPCCTCPPTAGRRWTF
jgi:hypothetical protein